MFGFSKTTKETTKQNILFHEDFSVDDVSEATAGRKGESLFYLSSLDVPIPDFFVVTPSVYKSFMLGAFEKKLAKLLDRMKDPDVVELEKLILQTDFPESAKAEIEEAYSRLSGFSNAWVAVRSSVVYPQDRSVSFSGLFHTELSVKGPDQVLEAIKYVYLSVFKNRVLLYASEKNVNLADLQMGVVVQRMVQPEVAGIAYTQDPITKDKKKMSIEAVFGLGDVITDGSITPDLYTLEKKDLNFVEKHISPQDWMRIRKPADAKVGAGDPFQKIQISKTWSHQQKLEDNYVQDIAKVSLIVEEKAKAPQMIEWAWESGNVWILQNKPLIDEQLSPQVQKEGEQDIDSLYDVALLMVKEEQQKKKESESKAIADKVLEKDLNEADMKDADEKEPKEEPVAGAEKEKNDADGAENIEKMEKQIEARDKKRSEKETKEKEKKVVKDKVERVEKGIPEVGEDHPMEFLLSGIGASTGKVTGRIMVVNENTPASSVVTDRDLLLLSKFTQEMEPLVMKCGGVVMDEGGLTSDLAILCREIEIPAVTGTGLASTLLKEGDFVMIDGNVGSIYRFTDKDTEKAEEKNRSNNDQSEDEKRDKENEVDFKDQEKEENKEEKAVVKAEEDDKKDDEEKKASKEKTDEKPIAKASDKKIPTATRVLMHPDPNSKASKYEGVISQFDGISYVDFDSYILDDGRHPADHLSKKKFDAYAKQMELILDGFADLAPGDEVVVALGSATSGQLRSLTNGKSLEPESNDDSLFGAQRLLSDKKLLTKYIEIIKKVRNVYKSRNISLAIHAPVNESVLSNVKKELSSGGLKRTGTFNIYAVIDNSSEVILVDEIISAGIDGLVVNTPLLAMQMQGLSINTENPKYNIEASSVWTVVENILMKSKQEKMKVIVQAEDSKKLIKNCIEKGAYGVSVKAEDGEKLRKYVSDEEAKMIMSIE